MYALLSLLLTLTAAQAAPHQPEALSNLISEVQDTAPGCEAPVAVFDLDDTLINTRERTQRILRDFAAQPAVARQYPAEAARISRIAPLDVHYLMQDTLQGIGVDNAALAAQANDFWLQRFFTDEYCAHDVANPYAVSYVNRLYGAGATIIYLSGRDIPRMGLGTEANLRELGFPLDSSRAQLILKPDPKQDDLAFKISQFDHLGRLGQVVGVFENEPANINAMAAAFPDAIAIFLDTIHSPKPDQVREGIFWVGDFGQTSQYISKNKTSTNRSRIEVSF